MKATLRTLAFAAVAAPVTALAWFVAFASLALDPRRGRLAHAVARLWARALLAAAGARLVVRGAERWAPSEPRVIVANHSSYMDIPALLAAFPGPMRIVAKEALRRMPFVGWHLALAGHFFLDREDPRQALALMAKASARMTRHRLSALVFAEGTRSPTGFLAPLKPGSFFLPLSAGVAVQPVAVIGSRAIMPKGAWGPRAGGTIEVRVGEPIPMAGPGGAPAAPARAAAVRAARVARGAPVAPPEAGDVSAG